MRKKETTFENIYQMPLHIDENCPIYVLSSNKVKVFNILIDDIDKINEMLSVINGIKQKIYENVEYANQRIIVNGTPTFLVRGWGYLTGIGTLNLSSSIATKIQDEFCSFIVNKLKGR